jgi:hypothetical protein
MSNLRTPVQTVHPKSIEPHTRGQEKLLLGIKKCIHLKQKKKEEKEEEEVYSLK